MRYSSHLYLRTDATLGCFPIIEIDDKGTIVSIRECGETLQEISSTRFFAGVIIPRVNPFVFSTKDDFISQCQLQISKSGESLSVGSSPRLMLVDSFDLNEFSGANARFSIL